MAAVAFAAFFGAESAFAAAMPEEIEKQLSERLPAAFVPVPASGAVKIFPLVSDKRKSPDRKYAITVDGTPFAITAIGDGGKLVEMSVPAGLHTEEFTNRWFKAEDVFGKIKWKLEPYTPEVPCLAYLSGGKGPLELVAKIPGGTPCAVLGTVVAGKATQKLVQVRRPLQGGGQENSFMLTFLKENPPVKTQAEYDARAKQMMAEHAFRTGRPWGKMFPSVLGNTSCFECAAMAADAATYMFDGDLGSGERFEKRVFQDTLHIRRLQERLAAHDDRGQHERDRPPVVKRLFRFWRQTLRRRAREGIFARIPQLDPAQVKK